MRRGEGDAPDRDGDTSLHLAVSEGYAESVQALLAAGGGRRRPEHVREDTLRLRKNLEGTDVHWWLNESRFE